MKRLPQVPSTGLGVPTIMDRALAAAHGSPYVQLVVFAIDIDRVYGALEGEQDESTWPFGWEVLLTEAQLLRCIEGLAEEHRLRLLEDTCLRVLEQPPDAQGLGSQLVFAVYDALKRGALPETLGAVFGSWRSPPRQLLGALSAMWRRAPEMIPQLAEACLRQPLSPPLAEPTRAALSALRAHQSVTAR